MQYTPRSVLETYRLPVYAENGHECDYETGFDSFVRENTACNTDMDSADPATALYCYHEESDVVSWHRHAYMAFAPCKGDENYTLEE